MSTTGTEPPRGSAAPQAPASATATTQQRVGSSRDMAGRKREYETIYILRPDSTSDVIAQVNQKVRGVIESGGGTLLKIDNWGKRKLAYEVKKQLKGIYLFFSYLGTAGLLEEVERNLRLTDSVIRYYSVKIAENVDPAARTSEFTEEAFTKAATPGPDEEEIATGQANVRSPFDEEEGAFDFEEAVFGGVDEPARRGGKDKP
jgi:small subunit ribosomal protein S6